MDNLIQELKRCMLRLFSLIVPFALALSSGAAHAQLTEQQPQILFDGGEFPDSIMDHQIYVMDPDGSHVQSLTETPPGTLNRTPAWSPDRQKIAFVSVRDGQYIIWIR